MPGTVLEFEAITRKGIEKLVSEDDSGKPR
jgi:hypothetical protein